VKRLHSVSLDSGVYGFDLRIPNNTITTKFFLFSFDWAAKREFGKVYFSNISQVGDGGTASDMEGSCE
jgi:hypothetical protein